MRWLMTIGILGGLLILAPLSVGAGVRGGPSEDVARILQLHEAVLSAHRSGDAEALLAVEPDDIVRASRGEVRFPPRDERLRRFRKYLQQKEFETYRDLIDPIVRVSDDGTLGWLIAQVEIVGTQVGDDGEQVQIDSVWAWIELYEKRDDRGYCVGDVSNVREANRPTGD